MFILNTMVKTVQAQKVSWEALRQLIRSNYPKELNSVKEIEAGQTVAGRRPIDYKVLVTLKQGQHHNYDRETLLVIFQDMFAKDRSELWFEHGSHEAVFTFILGPDDGATISLDKGHHPVGLPDSNSFDQTYSKHRHPFFSERLTNHYQGCLQVLGDLTKGLDVIGGPA